MVFILQTAAGILSEATISMLGLGPYDSVSLGKILNEAIRNEALERRSVVGVRPGDGAHHGHRLRALRAQHVDGRGLQPEAPEVTMTPVLEVDNLRVHYLTRFGAKVQAVDGVSFKLKEGEILGIAGESGCGKTTLVSGCMGLYIPPLHHTSGDVRIDGKSIIGMSLEQNRKEVLGRQIAMIPQGALNSLNPTRKIKDLAADMILSHDETADKKDINDRLRQRFERIGLKPDEVLDAYPVQLPGRHEAARGHRDQHAAQPQGGHCGRALLRTRRLHAKGGHQAACSICSTRGSSRACSSSPTSCRFFVTCRAPSP